jgi:hypothetical protein
MRAGDWCKAMVRTLGGAAVVLLLGGTLGCGLNSTVSFVLEFPTEGHFLASSAATVRVYDAEENIEICRQLSAGEDPGSDALADLPATDVCDYQNSDLTLGNLDQGVRAIYVEVTGTDEAVILRGCRIFNLSFEREPVQVDLAATPEFNTNAVMDSEFETAAERCGG